MKSKNVSILILFLLGIFMGGIDSGIVSPAREIIQNSFGVTQSTGIWMITIYTLVYAVSMPIIGKMGDRYGYKKIYTLGIAIFGLGSLLCGLSNFYGNFYVFLLFRAIQAIGAGGILPIATTVIGLSFSEKKRGTALGFVGAVFGVATIIGPTLGSSILSAAGNENWGWIFFINVPITIVILLLSMKMENIKGTATKALDVAGVIAAAATIGSLMYALTNINFFKFKESIQDLSVYPYLIIFITLIPVLIRIESKAEDPIINLKYFKNRQLLIVFIIAFVVGIGMMGMVFVPQFAENVLKIKPGTGGYLITLLAVFAGVSSPLSGMLTDKIGAKVVMIIGFIFTISGALYLGYVTTKELTFISVFIGLALMGFGLGFTMGAPLNYLTLKAVDEKDSASAMATMSLVRAMGVTISPSIMIGFIVDAAQNLQTNLMHTIIKGFSSMMPKAMKVPIGGSSLGKIKHLFKTLERADVTSIVDRLKKIFSQVVPPRISAILGKGLENMRGDIEKVFQITINQGYTHMFTAVAIIAGIGILAALFLKKPKRAQIETITN